MHPIEAWHALLGPDERSARFFAGWSRKLREAKLTFGDRVHCPFLRPLFVTEEDEARIRVCAETVAAIGERVAATALVDRALLDAVGLQPEEERLVRIEPGYARASTASRLDAFLLPETLEAAEYNAESPAGFGYSESLAELFSQLPVMTRFAEAYEVETYRLSAAMLDALLASYRDWGGTASPPLIAIVDWREVPTWTEFEILQARFTASGVPTIVCDPRDLEFTGRTLGAQGRRIDLVYRRVLMNDVLGRSWECQALVDAYEARAVCVANTFRCKVPHKKAFFAVLTDERFAPLLTPVERAIVGKHIPWTRLVREGRTTRGGAAIDLIPYIRGEREHLVLKPNDEYGGSGVTLGWEQSASSWDNVLQAALAAPAGTWIVQERIQIRREVFPWFQGGDDAVFKDMLVDMAPYLFRGRLGGFLTRLSATGLANVTSGGGQVPSFKIRERSRG